MASCSSAGELEIVSLSANPQTVAPGERAVIVYRVEGATTIDLAIEGGATLLTDSTNPNGSVVSPPLDADTTFVLTAKNAEKSAQRSITVNVDSQAVATIDALTATPELVGPGEPITLAWQTTNAQRGELRIGDRVLYSIPTAMLAGGSYIVDEISKNTRFTLAISGTREVTRSVDVGFDGPKINTFTADPNPVRRGRTAMLTWDVERAARISISGNLSGVLRNDTALRGSIEVSPAFDELYTLLATDDRNHTANATVALEVTVLTGAEVISFDADPTTIEEGGSATLSWVVANAPGGVVITAGSTVLTSAAAERGSIIVTPSAGTTYTLRAINAAAGDDTAEVSIAVTPPSVAVTSFTASPNPVAANTQTTLSWTTSRATDIRLFRGSTLIHESSTELDGMFDVDVDAANLTFRLEASDGMGTASQNLDVFVHSPPRINSLDATPRALLSAGTVTVLWDAPLVNRLQLFANGVPVPNFTAVDNGNLTSASGGSIVVNVTVSTTFELIATTAAGSTSARVSVSRVAAELEPNDSAMTAMPLAGSDGASGSIAASMDVDWYALVVPDGFGVFAETGDGAGHCSIDTVLSLYAPDGATALVTADDGGAPVTTGFGECSKIDWRTNSAARALSAGTYYLAVRHNAAGTGPYTLIARAEGPGCGNGFLEPAVNEQCDDGNSAGGDGCSPTCTIEALGTIAGPNSNRTFSGAISILREIDYYAIDLAAPGYIRAETFAPSAPACAGTDTILRLLDAAFVELTSDDQSGTGSCSRILPEQAARAAGRYYLSVEESGGNDVIPQYTLEVALTGVGCGNGFLESGETCDDANLAAGDGCDAQCSLEGTVEDEALGNDAANQPGVLTATTDTLFAGSIAPLGDEDWYAVVVPSGHHLDAYTSSGQLDDCPNEPGPRARLALFAPDRFTQLAVSSSGGPNDTCGRISPMTSDAAFEMNAGTYYLRVDEFNRDATMSPYFLSVRTIAPGCANGVRETGEQCEDGGTMSGDGCSATCTFELHPAILTPPTGAVQLTIAPPGFAVARVLPSRAGQSIEAVAADPGGLSCDGANTRIELYDASFALAGVSETGGPTGTAGTCAAILYPSDVFATDLANQVYYVVVSSSNNATVELGVAFHDPACGNSVIERRDGEQCDDGNSTAGDGCSATCDFEPSSTIAAPTMGSVLRQGAISTIGETDVYELDVASDVYLIAETFAPTQAMGCNADTLLTLYDAGANVLGEDDQDGINRCSRIALGDAFSLLAAGTYYLAVTDAGDDETIAAYDLVLEARPANVCGNGVLEGVEACDDGSVAAGDGCSPTCTFEGTPPILDQEPNDAALSAQSLGAPMRPSLTDVAAGIRTAGDEDWFTFDVTGTTNAGTVITTFGALASLSTCGFDSELWLYDDVPTNLVAQNPGGPEPALVAYDNNDGFGACAQVEGTDLAPLPLVLAPGTYYLRIRAFNNASLIPQYFVRIDLR